MSLGEYPRWWPATPCRWPMRSGWSASADSSWPRRSAVARWAWRAVSGLDAGAVEELCASVSHAGRCQPALFNAPRQVTVAGDDDAVGLLAILAERSGEEVRRLQVSSAFHTSLMSPAAPQLDALLAATPIGAPRTPIVANATRRTGT